MLTHSHEEGQSGMNIEWISKVYGHNQPQPPDMSLETVGTMIFYHKNSKRTTSVNYVIMKWNQSGAKVKQAIMTMSLTTRLLIKRGGLLLCDCTLFYVPNKSDTFFLVQSDQACTKLCIVYVSEEKRSVCGCWCWTLSLQYQSRLRVSIYKWPFIPACLPSMVGLQLVYIWPQLFVHS